MTHALYIETLCTKLDTEWKTNCYCDIQISLARQIIAYDDNNIIR